MKHKENNYEPVVTIINGEQPRQLMMSMLAKLAMEWHENNCKTETKEKILCAQVP